MSETKQPDTKKAEAKPTLHKFHVGKYDLTVEAPNAKEAVKIAEQLSKKEEK